MKAHENDRDTYYWHYEMRSLCANNICKKPKKEQLSEASLTPHCPFLLKTDISFIYILS